MADVLIGDRATSNDLFIRNAPVPSLLDGTGVMTLVSLVVSVQYLGWDTATV